MNSVNLVTKVSRPATSITVPARVGTYLIKAVDKLGNFSSNATAVISNVTSVTNFNAVSTVNEHPTFAGTKNNVVISDDAIILDSSELFDSASGNFDGMMSQAHFIDGLALGPGYFGFSDSLTGTWRPQKFKAEGTTVNDGRVFSSTVMDSSLKIARKKALETLDFIDWKNKYYRKDIAFRVIDK